MGKTIVVIDASAAQRRFLETLLALDHYTVVSFGSGLEALGYLQLFSADLIITDIRVPQLDGIELCKTLKAEADLRNIPVVVLTALELAELRDLLVPPVEAIVYKSAVGKGLRQMVKTLLEQTSLPPQTVQPSLFAHLSSYF